MTKGKYWIAMVKVSNDYYVLASNDGTSINDFGTKNKALKFFTGAYDAAHLRSVQGSRSAVISNATSEPRIIEADLGMLATKLFDEKAGIRPVKFGANLGFLSGWRCNRPYDVVEKVYKSGTAPELSSVEA